MLRCGPPTLRAQGSTRKRAPLIPKLRGSFAEFLSGGSLGRLGVLTPAHLWRFAVRAPRRLLTRLFLEAWNQKNFPGRSQTFGLRLRLAPFSPAVIDLHGPTPHVRWGRSPYPSPSPRRSTRSGRCWNVDQLSIAYALRLWLRSRLTLRRLTFRRKPWAFGALGFHQGWRYSFRDSHSPSLHPDLPSELQR